MNLEDIIKKLTSGDIPAWAMGGAGIVLLLIVMKASKGFMKVILLLLALALLAGAVGWYLHKHGRI